MNKSDFPLHGNIKSTLNNNIVTLDIVGPCNLEFIKDMEQQMLALRNQLPSNYAGLIKFSGEALGTPEAISYFTGYLKTIRATAVALYVEDAINPTISRNLLEKAYLTAGIRHRFFDNTQEAVSWLRDCLEED